MRRALLVAGALAATAGCGGGSNPGSGDPTPTPSATATPTTGSAFTQPRGSASISSGQDLGRRVVLRRPLVVADEPVEIQTATVSAPDSVSVRPLERGEGDGTSQSLSTSTDKTDGPLAGTTVEGSSTDAVIAFTPRRAGVVTIGGLTLTYRQGGSAPQRQTLAGLDCFVVGPGPSECGGGTDLTFDPAKGVTALGLTYPRGDGTRLRRADGGLGVEAVLDGRPHPGDLTVTLVNGADEPARVGDFTTTTNAVEGGQRLTLRAADETPFVLAPGEARDVTLNYRVAGCVGDQPLGTSGSFPATDSRTDEAIPLGVAIAVAGGPRC